MEFIDHTGHVFSLEEWSSYPVGYEYEIGDYVFWIESSHSSHTLSTSNYYILPIRMIVDPKEEVSVTIKDSDKFMLLGSSYIQSLIEKNESVFDVVDIDTSEFNTTLSASDLSIIDSIEVEGRAEKVSIATFYVISRSIEEGTWMTDVLIQNGDAYCPITVGGEFQEEASELIINGENMGIVLPKDILNSIYEEDLWSDEPDEALLKKKMKELMMAYMHIKGECGNYESAKDSLDWFGYKDHMSLRCLLQTDNEVLSQYVHDSFDTSSDNEWSWNNFRHSSAYSIWMDINHYLDEEDPYRYDEELVGEGKPLSEDLTKKIVHDVFDEEDIKFWRPYYKWSLQDLYIKVSMVAYYWKKYFLPICATISSASMKHHAWMNDIKYVVKPQVGVCETPAWTGDPYTYVKFQGCKEIYIYNQEAYFDPNYNEMSDYEKIGKTTDEEILYIDDICARVPLYFGTKKEDDEETFFDVTLVLTRGQRKIYSSSFQFYQRKGEVAYKNFILIPKSLVKNFDFSYWIDKDYRLSINCNGNWHYYDFTLKVPEFKLRLGTLDYKYYTGEERHTIEEGDDRWVDTSLPEYDSLTEEEKRQMNEYTVTKSMFTQVDSITDDSVNFNAFMYIPSLTEVNDINFFDKLQYRIDAAQSDDTSASGVGSTSEGSTLTINSYCQYLASKCYVYSCGFEMGHNRWRKGEVVKPMFRFNNGIALGSIEGYKLKKFDVDILYDVDTDNNWYAKQTFHLDDLSDLNISDDVREWSISDRSVIQMKSDLGLKGVVENNDGTIDWNSTSASWRSFYIDEHTSHKGTAVVRIVTSGEIELPSGRTYSFGGYKANGMPRIFTDLPMSIAYNDDDCTMNCNCPFREECKFRSKDMPYDYDKRDDVAEGEEKKNQMMSDLAKKTIDELVSSYSQNIVTTNNKRYLNTVHIYDLYLTKMSVEQKKRLGLKTSKIHKLQYNPNVFDARWWLQDKWEQTPELIEMYRMFFNDDGTCKVELPDSSVFSYDFYLMHDEDYWFVVLISQMTNEYAQSDADYAMDDEITFKPDDSTSFTMKRYRSSSRFLMNRMFYTESYPKNHFKQDDLIVATIDNVRFPFILNKTTKWEVKNLGLNMRSKPSIVSNTNSMVLSLYDDYNENASGYYDVNVRYSVDGIIDHQQKKSIRILITK